MNTYVWCEDSKSGYEFWKRIFETLYKDYCCDWANREDDDICGLDDNRITSDKKIKDIFEYSVLKDSFAKAGL